MRRLIVTVGALGLFGGLVGGCVVHEHARGYGYGYGYYQPEGHEHWRAEERHEEHEEHEHHHW